MSPEQARGQEVDARTDVFAFGVVLFEMLTGERPFVGETTQDVLTAVMRDTPKRASHLNPLVAPEIDRVVERCLEKLRDARYANGQELVDALSAVLPEPRVSEASSARRAPSPPTVSLLTPEATAGPTAKAARGRLPLLLASVAVLLGIGGIVAWRSRIAPATGPSATASAPRGVTSGIAITDHPPPRTASAEALAAYTSGLRHVRDGETAYAADDFSRAATLDPSMAAADLRAVLISGINGDVGRQREYYAAALEHRAALDARDLLLLQLAEVAVADPELPNDEGPRRARAVVERFPEDAEAAWLLGVVLVQADDAPAGRAALGHALRTGSPVCRGAGRPRV
jgi:Protein tyrosine and serine/threonine kinase